MVNIKVETLALAALCQGAQQILRIAETGFLDEPAAAAVLRAVSVTAAPRAEDIYDPTHLRTGLQLVRDCLSGLSSDATSNTLILLRLLFKLTAITGELVRQPPLMRKLAREIDELAAAPEAGAPDFAAGLPAAVLQPNYLHRCAEIYTAVISPNFSKLLIYGNPQYLTMTEHQEQIRALLLGGIRAAVLWRQVGGRRRYLLFRRRAIVGCAARALTSGRLD